MIFEAPSKDEAAKWLFRLRKSAVMGSFMEEGEADLSCPRSDPDDARSDTTQT